MILWYVLPLFLIFSISALFNQKLVWAAGLLLVVLPVTYLASRWEINRFLLPKKQGLESLREKLVANSSE